jgi:hypothetical protein
MLTSTVRQLCELHIVLALHTVYHCALCSLVMCCVVLCCVVLCCVVLCCVVLCFVVLCSLLHFNHSLFHLLHHLLRLSFCISSSHQPEFYRVCHTKAQYDEEGPRIARHSPVFSASM